MPNIRFVIVLIFCFCTALGAQVHAQPSFAVASAHPVATQAGVDVLKQGGNAFDAAIAVATTLAVVEPYSAGLGGGGFWLLYEAKEKRSLFLDSRETAPGAFDPPLDFNQADLRRGALSVATPGLPASIDYLAQHYAALPLADDLAPAIAAAAQGFLLDDRFVRMLNASDADLPDSDLRALFYPQGEIPSAGERLVQSDLAKTLRLWADEGPQTFYQGTFAKQLIDYLHAQGGVLSLADLADYQVIEREPLTQQIADWHITTAPPPSAGGIALITLLSLYNTPGVAQLSAVQQNHFMIESMRRAYWDSDSFVADPDFLTVPSSMLIDPRYHQRLRASIAMQRAGLPRADIDDAAAPGSLNTTHFSIIDDEGNRVAATLSINYRFGSGVVVPGTGVILNNHMADFVATQAKHVVNSVQAGARPRSYMTPTFIETPEKVVVLGSPGGGRIPSVIFLAARAMHDSDDVQDWVSRARFHQGYASEFVYYEPDAFSDVMQASLITLGHQLKENTPQWGEDLPSYGDMQVVVFDKKTQRLDAASDPRHMGSAYVNKVR